MAVHTTPRAALNSATLAPALTLRDYQLDALAAIRAAEAEGLRRLGLQMPTGTGKTVMFAGLVAEDFADSRGRVLVLAHREELLAQAAATFERMLPAWARVGIVQANRDDADADVVLASIATVRQPARLARILAHGALTRVIVDEAHHAAADSYQSVLRALGVFDDRSDAPLLLGVSATLYRADSRGLGETFERVVYDVQLLDMVQRGYLANLRALRVTLNLNLDAIGRVGDDYNQAQLADALTHADAPVHVATALVAHARGRISLVFTPTVALAEATAEAAGAEGFHAAVVSGETDPDARRQLFAAVRDGRLDVLVNCAIATEGTDLPRVDCVVIARPTRSKVLYVQMIGRGTRLHPAKADCLVIDCVGATARHDVMTAAALFSMSDAELADGVVETLDTRAAAAQVAAHAAQEAAHAAALRAEAVDLFRARQRVGWVSVGAHFAAGVGADGTVALYERAPDAVDVLLLARERAPVALASSLASIELAQGVAEAWVRSDPNRERLAAPGARWRGEAASDKQRAFLARFARTERATTRGEAADAMTRTIARWQLAAAGLL